MARTVNVNFRMDSELKKDMEQVCMDMGLSMTAAFTIFAKTVTREKRIPFEVSADPFYSASNMRHLQNTNLLKTRFDQLIVSFLPSKNKRLGSFTDPGHFLLIKKLLRT